MSEELKPCPICNPNGDGYAWAHKRIAKLEDAIKVKVMVYDPDSAKKIADLEHQLATEKRQHETAQKDFLKVMEEAGAKYDALLEEKMK